MKYQVIIDVEYDGKGIDPGQLLDSIQDNCGDLLSPYGETVETFEVSVIEKDDD